MDFSVQHIYLPFQFSQCYQYYKHFHSQQLKELVPLQVNILCLSEMHVFMCIYIYIYMCVCVCVCVYFFVNCSGILFFFSCFLGKIKIYMEYKLYPSFSCDQEIPFDNFGGVLIVCSSGVLIFSHLRNLVTITIIIGVKG